MLVSGVQQSESVIHIHISTLLDTFPIEVIVDYWAVFLVLCSESLLVIYLMYSSMYIGEGNSTPLQYSCLENPIDGGAW